MATEALCGGGVTSQRGLLAFLWSLVNILSAVAFLSALIFTISIKKDEDEDGYYNNNAEERNEEQDDMEPVIALTSRAMAFAALWTAVMATLLAIFGTVVLGWQSPTGQYYTCCSPQVHRTTPIALGSFIGALLMFANLTLVCSVLFGEFEVCLSCIDNTSAAFRLTSHLLSLVLFYSHFHFHLQIKCQIVRFEITEKANSVLRKSNMNGVQP